MSPAADGPRRPPALDADVLPGLVGYEQSALDEAGVSLVISDARTADLPICWVSPAFTALTGYPAERVLGVNCRFLQTEQTSENARARIRDALAAGEPVRETLLNRRADGSVFWNELLLAPLRAEGDVVTHVAGYQVDVTSRVTAHAAHDRFLEAERRARSQAGRTRAPR
ncbi:PAS domain-containing protein [Kineococcus sp. NPDC059986]|jgi:PAS domain S-box-containing protein|uniref:PAS domain-containing protein n=1 Tax=Kineococcus sp. NPDC059986 TaxID=3155538 RepID=UPI00344EBD94